MSISILTDTADTAEPAPVIHALHSSWSTAECGATTGWNRAFYVGGITCPDCLTALPDWAANEAAGVTS